MLVDNIYNNLINLQLVNSLYNKFILLLDGPMFGTAVSSAGGASSVPTGEPSFTAVNNLVAYVCIKAVGQL